jgi:hypothetical protein
MSDKLQFVAGLCGWFAAPDHDKLKFVGHFPHNNKVGLRPEAPSSPNGQACMRNV